MKAVFAALVAIAVFGALVVAPVMAQQAPAQAPTQAPAPAAGAAKTVQGKVMAVDPSGKSITLDDGTKLTIPESVKFSRADLKPGAAVKAAYEEKDGQKILTSLEIAK
jgi:Cu/Ag efflux protein CusF